MKTLPKFIGRWLLQRAFALHNTAFAELRIARERDAFSIGTPSEGQAYAALAEAQKKHRRSVALLSKRLTQFGTA